MFIALDESVACRAIGDADAVVRAVEDKEEPAR